jgi:hypothetical protein
MYKPEMEWKKRVIDIYNQYKELSNEILPVEGDGGQD